MMRLCLAHILSLLALAAVLSDGAQAQSRGGDKKKKPESAATAPGGGQATLVETFADWSAYTAQSGRAKICYALTQPKARTPANLKDTPAYLFVSFRPADNVKNEVAAVLNFDTKDGGTATLTVDRITYELVTKGKNAWVKNPSEEILAIGTMAKGKAMSVSATSAKGNKTGDRYSLAGFQQALDRARRECP